jgi:hypothetical protein
VHPKPRCWQKRLQEKKENVLISILGTFALKNILCGFSGFVLDYSSLSFGLFHFLKKHVSNTFENAQSKICSEGMYRALDLGLPMSEKQHELKIGSSVWRSVCEVRIAPFQTQLAEIISRIHAYKTCKVNDLVEIQHHKIINSSV